MRASWQELRAWIWLVAAAVLVSACGCPAVLDSTRASLPPEPNIIVILVDTLRADATGFGGCRRDTTPQLDQWAARGVVFEKATTPAGWTKPAVVSLLSGLYPATHSVEDKDHVAPEKLLMLPEVLRARGYETAAYVTNFAVSERFGLGQGFDIFRFFDKKLDAPPDAPRQLNYVQAEHVLPEVERFLEREHQDPFFLYLHLTDPHHPYIPPKEHLLFGTDARGRYDGELHYIDAQLGALLDLLETKGLLGTSLVVLTADHGEEFHEHGGSGHGVTVFEECVRVPLVFWAPGLAPGRRQVLVSLTDLAPTLLEAAQLVPPEGFAYQGRSLWPAVQDSRAAGSWNWSVSELVYPSKAVTFSYREGDEKLVYIQRDIYKREDLHLLFDLAQDPGERQNLARQRPERFAYLQQKMRALRQEQLAAAVGTQQEDLDEEAISRLRALGYID